jgi:transcriptional regulator with XRE-family HTH domain
MKIGTSIKNLRKGITPKLGQQQLAKNTGLSQTYLSLIEDGKRNPTIAVLDKIAKSLNIPLPVIFWFSIESSDIDDSKKEYFEFLKPILDGMINHLIPKSK